MAKIYLIESFLEYLKSGDRADSTISSYRSDLYLFAQWFEKTNHEILSAIKITPTDLRHYKKHLIEYPMKPKTINRKLGIIKVMVTWLWDTNKLKQRFPVPKPVKEVVYAPKWLDNNQQHQLLRHIEKYSSERDAALIKLLLNTGLRVNELSNIKWTDISISDKKGALKVRYSKAGKYRKVPLNKDSRSCLIQLGYKSCTNTGEYVLLGQRGPLSVRGIQKILGRRLAFTSLDNVTPHILRHTFCKNLVNAGVTLEKVAMLAGHNSLDTTKLYCQPSFDDLSDSVELISEEEQ
jgi:integrase/recombinase XerC